MQKHCKCTPIKPFCCRTGWHVTAVGSRFTHTAEARYAPIEGEALAVAYALDHARYFTLGCEDLTVAVDHKPLLSFFEKRSLDIPNNRLRNLKEKTLRYRFKMVHISGWRHKASDAVSRKPVGSINPPILELPDDVDVSTINNTHFLQSFISTLCSISKSEIKELPTAIDALSSIHVVTWGQVKHATSIDPELQSLISVIQSGFPTCDGELHNDMKKYYRYKMYLKVVDDVVLFNDRILIPMSLRQTILSSLHSAHQGVTRMVALAESCVFWPNITKDIEAIRVNCTVCNRISPSQPHAPATELQYAEYPFQLICADYFSYRGKSYLVIVDRYSNWPIIEKGADGSKGLINCLRETFSTYGIPDEIATDGGLEFTSHVTQQFLSDWGVKHRVSSVAFPHSNCRAEIGVKSAKRMLSNNTDANGGLNLDAFRRAMLSYRTTPDPETGLSPAHCIFGRTIKSFIPIPRGGYKPHAKWIEMLDKRGTILKNRHQRLQEVCSEHKKNLPPLRVGDRVRVQNQIGPDPLRWEKTGLIVEVKKHDQYCVKIDGLNRVSLRNRKFLKKYEPVFVPRSRIVAPSHCLEDSQPHFVGGDRTVKLLKEPDTPCETSPAPTLERGPQREKLPRMVRCLAPHNRAGLKE